MITTVRDRDRTLSIIGQQFRNESVGFNAGGMCGARTRLVASVRLAQFLQGDRWGVGEGVTTLAGGGACTRSMGTRDRAGWIGASGEAE